MFVKKIKKIFILISMGLFLFSYSGSIFVKNMLNKNNNNLTHYNKSNEGENNWNPTTVWSGKRNWKSIHTVTRLNNGNVFIGGAKKEWAIMNPYTGENIISGTSNESVYSSVLLKNGYLLASEDEGRFFVINESGREMYTSSFMFDDHATIFGMYVLDDGALLVGDEIGNLTVLENPESSSSTQHSWTQLPKHELIKTITPLGNNNFFIGEREADWCSVHINDDHSFTVLDMGNIGDSEGWCDFTDSTMIDDENLLFTTSIYGKGRWRVANIKTKKVWASGRFPNPNCSMNTISGDPKTGYYVVGGESQQVSLINPNKSGSEVLWHGSVWDSDYKSHHPKIIDSAFLGDDKVIFVEEDGFWMTLRI